MKLKMPPAYLNYIFILIVISTAAINAQWYEQISGTTEKLTDVVMLDSIKAIAIGDRNGIFRTTDAGSTWINETIVLSAVFHWNAISFSDTLNGTIVGNHSIWQTSDGGINWNYLNVPSYKRLLSVLQISPENIYIGADSGWIYYTFDTARTWKSQKISNYPIRKFFEWTGTTAAIFKTPLYALTTQSICSRGLSPGDTTWTESVLDVFKGLGSEAFDAEYSKGGGPGFIVGVQGDLVSSAVILRKEFSDTTWEKIDTAFFGYLFGVSAPFEKVVYACGSSGLILKSADGGNTWNQYQFPYERPYMPNFNSIYFWDENNGFTVGDNGSIFHTSNGGSFPAGNYETLTFNKYSLSQNYPNPFNPVTIIEFQIAKFGFVSLKVFDILGREAATLVNEEIPAGRYEVEWNASNLSSGIYFYWIQAGNYSITKKMIYLK